MPESPGLPTGSRVHLQPIGRRSEVEAGQTLLEAARRAGVDLVSLCGGEGWCYTCRVRLSHGELTPLTSVERDALTPEEIAAGFRLACQAEPHGDVTVEVPPESLSAQPRLQVEGQETAIQSDPVIVPVDITVREATLHDQRSDTTRLQAGVTAAGGPRLIFSPAIVHSLSDRLRAQGWTVRLGLRKSQAGEARRRAEVVVVSQVGAPLLGVAIDIGTTKVAAYLVDLSTGRTLAKAGAMNPQISYGEDVISRIAYTLEHPGSSTTLQARLVETLNELVTSVCREARATREQIAEAVIVGNTAMHHLFAGLPVRQLAHSPFVPAISEPLELRASDVGLTLASGAFVHLPPNIAGFVGADHVAMALATRVWETDRTLVALDIGTNTEVTVAHRGRIWSCSCASGPAFEGAHIHDGMRAAEGAIERVQIVDGEPRLKTIGDRPPIGICGSGIVDAISEFLKAGIIDRRGRLQEGIPRVSGAGKRHHYVLASPATTGHGRPVIVTRHDINTIQLAKAAIRVGVDLLLSAAGAAYDEIDEFIVAGAFGTYLDIDSSVRIGMFPPLPPERFKQVGNAAGAGARQMLISSERRQAAVAAAQRVEYVELTIHPEFTRKYVKALYF